VAPLITGAVLDHVAVAVERWSDAWPRYAVELGGEWASGGLNVGFGPAQLRYANGGRVEILQPWQTEDNPFLRRFLDNNGPGPHHFTFKVPDLASALGRAESAGFTPVGVDLTHPEWMEAFLHPRQATGIVVQLAQAAHAWESPPPEGFPVPGTPAASFVRATHAVADLAPALALFEALLGGSVLARGSAPDGTWDYVDLAWAHPPALRLVSPATSTSSRADVGPGPGPALQGWLGRRPGRLHHLAFAVPGADATGGAGAGGAGGAVPAILPGDGAVEVVEPDRNLGTRLVVVDHFDSLHAQ
jgi:hypothetical protein